MLIKNRNRLHEMVRDVAPHLITHRLQDLQRHRNAYIVPGPDYVWSVDGYLKLAEYGIEIYVAIDAYARYIVWAYVGITARTAVSCLKQYLGVLRVTQKQPRVLRSDRGGETVLMAAAHWRLRQSYGEVDLAQCYYFGTSVANQRIEAWWGQLTKVLLFRWRVSTKNL